MGSKFIGAGLATIALAGAGVGIGSVFSALILAISRNTGWEKQLFSYAFLGFAVGRGHFKKSFFVCVSRINCIFLMVDTELILDSVEIALFSMVMKEVLDWIGFFNEQYFIYWIYVKETDTWSVQSAPSSIFAEAENGWFLRVVEGNENWVYILKDSLHPCANLLPPLPLPLPNIVEIIPFDLGITMFELFM